MTQCAELSENKEDKLLGDVDLRRWSIRSIMGDVMLAFYPFDA